MLVKLSVLPLALIALGTVSGQSFGPIKYLGEIGHLGTRFDQRELADFGLAKVYPAASAPEVRFEGKDDSGKPWRATVAAAGGIGWTDVWRADFDFNSRPDLMIAATFPANGRCISPVTITFLMFDSRGRPVPWTIETFLLNIAGEGKMPALLKDLNHNRRAELIATGCGYSDPPRSGEDRGIEGIYEAEDAHWKLIKPSDLKPYLDAVRANHSRGDSVHFVPPEPATWQDHGNSNAAAGTFTIDAVLRADPNCRGVGLQVRDGTVQRLAHDSCEIAGKDRFQMAGEMCFGWPTVVVDGSGGREILSAGSSIIESKLKDILARRVPVALIGQSDPAGCSPTLLWIDQ
ncbi:MAG TPA: hypothetical protein VEV17_03900 [Bryobacteraceae bacterium]|nr:hypothetical protein [Bryobacteraceae bacterium]